MPKINRGPIDHRTFAEMLGDQRAAICPEWMEGSGFAAWAAEANRRLSTFSVGAVQEDLEIDFARATLEPWLKRMQGHASDVPQAAVHPATERATARRQGTVAVVPVRGPIIARRNIWEMLGLATSVETIGCQVTEAVNDPEVKAVVLAVDSPGGGVFGVPELGEKLMALRGTKPILAQADGMMASAAYWIGAAADEIIASPSALVGSVGVFILHVEISEALKVEGVKPTFIASTPEKVDGNPLEPLSETGEAELRALVDDAMKMFLGAVAKGRGTTAEAVRADYGKGHVLTAAAALKAGMIDKVRPLEATLAAYGVSATPQQAPAAARRNALAAGRRHREIDLLDI